MSLISSCTSSHHFAAPACGKVMAELVLDGKALSVNLDPFDPARFTEKTERGGRGRKKGGTSVGEQW